MSEPSILPLRAFAADVPPRDFSHPTVGQIIDWYQTNNPDASACAVAETERRRIWAEFGKVFGHQLVASCKPYQLQQFITGLASLKSAWSRRRWSATIQRPFNEAARLGLIDRNPFRGVRWPEGKVGRDWTEEEYRAVLRASPADMRRVIVFLRFSGARPGELRNTTRTSILFNERVIVLLEHKTARKTGKPRRVYLNDTLVKLLLWLARRNRGHEYLFLNSYGNPWTRSALCKRLRELRDKAGVSDRVKLHGLRATFATRAIINGVDLATLAELMGHSSVSMLEKHYLHVAGKPHLNASMEKAVGRSDPKTPGSHATSG